MANSRICEFGPLIGIKVYLEYLRDKWTYWKNTKYLYTKKKNSYSSIEFQYTDLCQNGGGRIVLRNWWILGFASLDPALIGIKLVPNGDTEPSNRVIKIIWRRWERGMWNGNRKQGWSVVSGCFALRLPNTKLRTLLWELENLYTRATELIHRTVAPQTSPFFRFSKKIS